MSNDNDLRAEVLCALFERRTGRPPKREERSALLMWLSDDLRYDFWCPSCELLFAVCGCLLDLDARSRPGTWTINELLAEAE